MRRRTGRTLVTLHALGALALAATLGAAPRQASAQPGKGGGNSAASVAQLRIKVQGNAAASGVLSFPRQGPNAVVSVVATDAAGKPVTAGLSGAKWTTSDADVAELYGGSSGASTRIVAQQDGRATVTVTALGKTASLVVVVGEARKQITAADVLPAFRVARLEVKQVASNDPDAQLSGRALLLGENGHNAELRVTAYAADGTPVPLADLPVTWATSSSDVIELSQENENGVRVVGREPGQAKVTATIQGVTLALDGYVGDARSTADAGVLAQAPTATAPPTTTTSPTATNTATVTPTQTTTVQAPTGVSPTTTISTATMTPTAASAPTTSTTSVAAPTTAVYSGTKAPTTMDSPTKTVGTLAPTTYAAPTGVGAAYVSGGKAVVTWTAQPGAVGYWIAQRNPDGTDVSVNPLDSALFRGTSGTTRELNVGTANLAVVAVYDEASNLRSAPSTGAQIVVPRWFAKYRVTVNGFKVNRETFDSPLNADGQHDEVYVTATWRPFDADGQPTAPPTTVGTYTYGDVNAARWQNSSNDAYRIKAGSAAQLGGLVTGDNVPHADPWVNQDGKVYSRLLPLLVWEGTLYEGNNSVQIAPALYEDDEVRSTLEPAALLASDLARYTAKRVLSIATTDVKIAQADGQFMLRKINALVPVRLVAPQVYTARESSARIKETAAKLAQIAAANPLLAVAKTAVQTADQAAATAQQQLTLFGTSVASILNLASNSKDRAIGLVDDGSGKFLLDPKVINLTYETAEQILAGTPGSALPAGIVELRFIDSVPGGNGDYSLYVQVQRVP